MKIVTTLGTLALGLVSCTERAALEPVAVVDVKRGDLQITLRAQGEIQAAQSTRLASQVQGHRTVLYLAPEGSLVDRGDLLVELDVSDLRERRAAQAIAEAAARSARDQARKELEVAEHSLEAARRAAEGELVLASVRLESFLPASDTDRSTAGTGAGVVGALRELLEAEWARSDTGERRYEGLDAALSELLGERDTGEVANRVLRQISQVELATSRLERARERLSESRKLHRQGNISDRELRSSETAYDAQLSQSTLAWNNLQLLIKFTLREEGTRLLQDVRNAELRLESIKASNEGTRIGLEADLRSVEAELALTTQRLERLDQQIQSAVMRAPSAGLVVYTGEGPGRGRGPVQEGMEVRERQALINLPDIVNMIVELRVPEAAVERLVVDQQARISVDSFPDRAFAGRVSHVAALPDSGSRFTNTNRKVYKATVSVNGENPGALLRPGMNATVEVLVQLLEGVVTVPVPALHNADGVSYVWKVTPEGPEATDVEIGANNGTQVEITEGLGEGDQVYLGKPPGADRS